MVGEGARPYFPRQSIGLHPPTGGDGEITESKLPANDQARATQPTSPPTPARNWFFETICRNLAAPFVVIVKAGQGPVGDHFRR